MFKKTVMSFMPRDYFMFLFQIIVSWVFYHNITEYLKKKKKYEFISTELIPNQFNELQNIVHGQLDSLSDPFV